MYYFIVLHSNNTIETELLTVLQIYPHIITYEKPTENPHYHIILKSDKATNYLSNMLRQKFTNNRQKSVSCKKVGDLSKAIVYIIKDLDIRSNTMITPFEMEQYKIQTIAINEDKKQKKLNTTFTQECIETWRGSSTWEVNLKQKIVEHILERLDSKGKGFDAFIIKRIYYAICNRYYGQSALRVIMEDAQFW